jgi:hypothetical protein
MPKQAQEQMITEQLSRHYANSVAYQAVPLPKRRIKPFQLSIQNRNGMVELRLKNSIKKIFYD